jgi:nicotinate-nucleotide adenylyltransferase
MRVALFGGTFDPPHRGHLAVARAAANEFSLDTVLFAPAANQPLKPHGSKASFRDRLAMVELLCATPHRRSRDAQFVPSTLDAPREDGQPNYTIDTLRHLRAELREQNPADSEAELFVITGADSFLDLRRWREPEALLQAAEWIVVSRPGFSFSGLEPLALTSQQRARVHLLEGVREPASASEVRDRLEAGLDASSLLTPEVLAYIREHQLYHSAKTS